MCGITGFWNLSTDLNGEEIHNIAQQMSDTLLHRCPDSDSIWVV